MSDDQRDVALLVDHLFRTEYGKMVAVLASIFGFRNLEIAEDLVQETLVAALHHWSCGEVPDNPGAWLMQVAKNKAVNQLKREKRWDSVRKHLPSPGDAPPGDAFLKTDIEDSVLRMIFACCHPQIDPTNQIALVLKTLCGFGSKEVARALLVSEEAINKRLYRAKRDIAERGIDLEVPGGTDLDERLSVVCRSLYLLFNEGYSAMDSEELIRKDLCLEAMRLCRCLTERFPEHPRVFALMALMCLHAARFDSRVDDDGSLVLFEKQDRTSWDRDLIQTGLLYLSDAARGDSLTTYHLEASIAAQHCTAPGFEETDWAAIQELYEMLNRLNPNPVVRLNLAIVCGKIAGAEAALEKLEALRSEKKLAGYPLLYAALGEYEAKTGRSSDAILNLRRALALTPSPRERGFLQKKIDALE